MGERGGGVAVQGQAGAAAQRERGADPDQPVWMDLVAERSDPGLTIALMWILALAAWKSERRF